MRPAPRLRTSRRRSPHRRAAAVAAAAGALGARGALFAQCAMCNTSASGTKVGTSLSWSVLFMLAALVTVVGWLVTIIVRSSRASRERGRVVGQAVPSRRAD